MLVTHSLIPASESSLKSQRLLYPTLESRPESLRVLAAPLHRFDSDSSPTNRTTFDRANDKRHRLLLFAVQRFLLQGSHLFDRQFFAPVVFGVFHVIKRFDQEPGGTDRRIVDRFANGWIDHIVEVFEKQHPGRLLDVIQLATAAGVFVENVIDVLEGLLKQVG